MINNKFDIVVNEKPLYNADIVTHDYLKFKIYHKAFSPRLGYKYKIVIHSTVDTVFYARYVGDDTYYSINNFKGNILLEAKLAMYKFKSLAIVGDRCVGKTHLACQVVKDYFELHSEKTFHFIKNGVYPFTLNDDDLSTFCRDSKFYDGDYYLNHSFRGTSADFKWFDDVDIKHQLCDSPNAKILYSGDLDKLSESRYMDYYIHLDPTDIPEVRKLQEKIANNAFPDNRKDDKYIDFNSYSYSLLKWLETQDGARTLSNVISENRDLIKKILRIN